MTNKTIRVLIAVELPVDLCAPYLQHIRDFDTAHPELRFELGISTRKEDEVIEPPPSSLSLM